MQARVNGEPRVLDPGTTIAELVRALTGDAETGGVAVARNQEVVPRARWAEERVDDGDRIEIIRAAQGG